MRIAIITETYPPEINGVSLTLARMVDGLHRRNHDLQLVRPRQTRDEAGERFPRFHEVLVRGLPIPMYPHLRMGLPIDLQNANRLPPILGCRLLGLSRWLRQASDRARII